MHRSSKMVGAVAVVLAEAPSELSSPEKPLRATFRSSFSRQGGSEPLAMLGAQRA